jgi:class 3 adenylate cyclase
VRSDLPTGTVTFVFTDIEGSTKLLHDLGADAYADALTKHRRVLRDAFARHGGVEVDTQGDAFFFAFPTAPGAVAAAEELTREHASGPIRVRVGVHTGTPLLTEEGYVGSDVHRAARIAASGHGGQVLVSSATAQLLELKLTDLGEHRFKDLSAPERVYQLGADELPPLKSLYRTNLPVPTTPGQEAAKRMRTQIGARPGPPICGRAPRCHASQGNESARGRYPPVCPSRYHLYSRHGRSLSVRPEGFPKALLSSQLLGTGTRVHRLPAFKITPRGNPGLTGSRRAARPSYPRRSSMPTRRRSPPPSESANRQV